MAIEPNQNSGNTNSVYGSQMPNWAYNTMTVESDGSETGDEQLRCFFNTAITDDGNLTFSGHLPMPEELDIGNAPHAGIKDDASLMDAMRQIRNPETVGYKKENLLKQIKMYHNLKTIGYNSWYDWNSNVWGTKWDAADSNINTYTGGIEIRFNTAWDMPRGWLSHIVKLPECSQLRINLVCEAEGESVLLDENGKEMEYNDENDINNNWYHSGEYVSKEPSVNGEESIITHTTKTAEQRWKDGEFN